MPIQESTDNILNIDTDSLVLLLNAFSEDIDISTGRNYT